MNEYCENDNCTFVDRLPLDESRTVKKIRQEWRTCPECGIEYYSETEVPK